MFVEVVKIANACWWAQRTANWTLFLSAIKLDTGFLPYFPAWGRTHYQGAVPAFLRDLGRLNAEQKKMLEIGVAFGNTSGKGHWSSLSYVTEYHNWLLKHYTPHLDREGEAWRKTSQNFAAIAAINEGVANVFSIPGKATQKSSEPSPTRVAIFSAIIRRWDVLGCEGPSQEMDAANSMAGLAIPSYWRSLFLQREPSLVKDDNGIFSFIRNLA